MRNDIMKPLSMAKFGTGCAPMKKKAQQHHYENQNNTRTHKTGNNKKKLFTDDQADTTGKNEITN